MSGERQLSIWTALGLWATAVANASVYGAWHGYRGRTYVVTLCVLAFFLAIQLLFAAGDFGERFARRTGTHGGVLVAIVPFLAYLIYLGGTNNFTWHRALLAVEKTTPKEVAVHKVQKGSNIQGHSTPVESQREALLIRTPEQGRLYGGLLRRKSPAELFPREEHGISLVLFDPERDIVLLLVGFD